MSAEVSNANEPGHEKMCLMSYANNKGADQSGLFLVWLETPEDTFCRVVA